MRLSDIEAKLSPAIDTYTRDVYPHLQGKPRPAVICMDDTQFKATLKTRDRKTMAVGAFNIPTNTLYFRNRPVEIDVAHEVEHWATSHEMGPDLYLEQLQSRKFHLDDEKSADDAASTNAHKLTGEY